MFQDEESMVIYVPFIDKLHCECDQNVGNGFAKLKKMQRVCVCVGGGGLSVSTASPLPPRPHTF